MQIDLTRATALQLADVLFDHPERGDDQPWYSGDIDFRVDPPHQLRLLTELFQNAASLVDAFRPDQIENGLWCVMGAEHGEQFCQLIWDSSLSLAPRRALVAAIYPLYDQVLAAPPYQSIHFGQPDMLPRRYRTIDYMVPDLLLDDLGAGRSPAGEPIRAAFLELFRRLLDHPAPVANYAALHGLGHLRIAGREALIDHYLRTGDLSAEQRVYAEEARTGDIL